ncbi:MAG: His-Xaa-Ser repeat protein HxsA3 [Oscillospiraceae bacterium]|nr:His-Xaa-Ser repeat protein HxsA3 [Oscillospiraceae bacterium]
MDEKKGVFPEIKKSICDFITEEEGSISRNKVIAIGALMLVMSTLMVTHVYAGHSSHRSHSSHSSHSSGSGGGGHGSHESHVSHSSHTSSTSHNSHSSNSHSNHSSHSNNTHSNTSSAHTSSSAAVKTSSHSNTAGIAAPTFTAPKLYDLSAIHNKLLGVHSTSSSAAVANLKISDFDD